MNNSINGLPGRNTPIAETRSTGAAASPPAVSADASRAPPSGSGADRIDLTDSARAIRDSEQVQGAAPAVDAGKVAAIRREIAEGRYSISAERVADGLLGIEQQLGGAA